MLFVIVACSLLRCWLLFVVAGCLLVGCCWLVVVVCSLLLRSCYCVLVSLASAGYCWLFVGCWLLVVSSGLRWLLLVVVGCH